MNDREHYEYDEHDRCPLCNRNGVTCDCTNEDIADYYEDQDDA